MRNTLGVLAGLGLSACAGACAIGEQSPKIDSIAPAQVAQTQATAASILGKNFYAFASVSLDNENVSQIDSDWDVHIEGAAMDPSSITVVGDTSIEIVVPAGLPAGYHDVTVVAPNGETDTLVDGLFVFEETDINFWIEDAGAGSGKQVADRKFAVGTALDLHSIGRRGSDSSYLFDVDASWQVIGNAGSVSSSNGTQTSFLASTVGTAMVSASHALYGQATTGTLSVVECLQDSDCLVTCRSSNICDADVCVQRPLDAECTNKVTTSFQEDVNGYVGTIDTSIGALTPNLAAGEQSSLAWQRLVGGAESATLIRFENIFGNGPSQIPVGSTIVTAELVTQPLAFAGLLTDPGSARVVKIPWDEQVTWNSFGSTPGYNMADMAVPFAAAPSSPTLICPCPMHYLDVTDSLRAMLAGAPNNGWIFVPRLSTLGRIASSEESNLNIRPKLWVTYLSP